MSNNNASEKMAPAGKTHEKRPVMASKANKGTEETVIKATGT
jgi:hypothetical protein